MRNKLDATILGVVDISDQPPSEFIFILEGLIGPRQAFAVDGITLRDETVVGWLANEAHVVVTVHQGSPWVLLNRSLLEPYLMREAIERAAQGTKELTDWETECYKAAFPEGRVETKPRETENLVVGSGRGDVGHYI